MSTPTLYANSELVCGAWLALATNLSSDNVSTSLPKNVNGWAGTGFVTYIVSGGTPDPDTGIRMPVMACYCWGRQPNSNKPSWPMANNLAESIYAATRSEALSHQLLALPGSYPAATVKEAVCVREAIRVPLDPGDSARYRIDVQLYWAEVS